MVTTTVRINDDALAWIRSLAETHGISQSTVLRAVLSAGCNHPDEVESKLRHLTAALSVTPPTPGGRKAPAKRPPPPPTPEQAPEPAPEPDWDAPALAKPDLAPADPTAKAVKTAPPVKKPAKTVDPALAQARKTVDKVEEAREAVAQVTPERGNRLGHGFRPQPGAPLRCTCGQPLNQH
jgi:hypothetical protein